MSGDFPAWLGEVLPGVNATLNGIAAVFIVAGWMAIRTRRISLHWKLMVAALACSALFLVFYVVRMALTGTHRFEGPPLLRGVYLTILASHVLLAIAVLPLVLRTVYLAAKRRYDEHVRIVRFTLPIWLYVSVTGVVIYVMLYRL